MEEEKWMIFINHYWGTLSYWEMLKLYREHNLQGAFFSLSALACRNEFLMRIAHGVHLCQEIAKNYDVGDDAQKTLKEILALYERKDTTDRSVQKFEDCGIKPFRDKILAHPANLLRAVRGKDQYELSLPWATVDETLLKIKQFATEVERHGTRTGRWNFSTFKDEVGDVKIGFMSVTQALDAAAKYDKLKHAVAVKGKVEVYWDWQKDAIIIAE